MLFIFLLNVCTTRLKEMKLYLFLFLIVRKIHFRIAQLSIAAFGLRKLRSCLRPIWPQLPFAFGS